MVLDTKGRCPMLWMVAFVQFIILLLSGVTVSPTVAAASSFSVCPYMSASRGSIGSVTGNSNAIHKLVTRTSSALFPLMKVLNMKGGAYNDIDTDSNADNDIDSNSYGGIDITDPYSDPNRLSKYNQDIVPGSTSNSIKPGTPQIMRIGLSHKDASVSVREKLATSEKKLNELSTQLVNTPSIREAMVLSTCNRFEIFIVATNPIEAASHVYSILSDRTGGKISADTLKSTMRVIVGAKDTATHLLRVSSGLDSIVLGEPQVCLHYHYHSH